MALMLYWRGQKKQETLAALLMAFWETMFEVIQWRRSQKPPFISSSFQQHYENLLVNIINVTVNSWISEWDQLK